MASIRNSISLQDHMTPVFRSIMKSMDSTLRLMRQVDQQANNGIQSKAYRTVERDIKRANNEILRMQNNIRRTDSAASDLVRTTNSVGTGFKNAFSSVNFTNIASGIYLIKNALNALSTGMSVPDTLNAIEYRLGQYDTTNATSSQLFNSVYRAAQNSRSDVNATGDLASRVLISGATKGNGGAAIHMAELLNKASFMGGATNEESKRALLQLSQGLSSGVLQGDELRAIREQAPGLTDVLSKGLSSMAERGALPDKFLNTSIGDLKQLGKEGELTADRIIAAFSEMEDYINETFEKSPKQFGQAMTMITNTWKRFFKQMSQGDNAFAKINEKAWELYEWFESDQGERFFSGLGTAINTVTNLLFSLVDGVSDAVSWFNTLDNSGKILKATLLGVAVAAAISAAASIVSFLAMNWVVLLVIAGVALLAYAFMSCGATIGQIIGFVLGLLAFLWDFIVYGVLIILELIAIVVAAVILVVQFIVQLILWLITTIIGIITALGQVWNTIWNGFQIAVKGTVLGIVKIFQGLSNIVLGILQTIAKGIDWVFGSNLADTIGGWTDGLNSSVDALEAELNITGDAKDIVDGWSDWGTDMGNRYAGKGEYDDWNIVDNMDSVITGTGDIMGDMWKTGEGMLINPYDAYDAGVGIGDKLSSFDPGDLLNLGDTGGLLDGIISDVTVNGGDLDSVGKIKSDVDISDEDIQLLRDIAARDFLLNVKTITPKANIKFGDVKETADVNKIVEVIEDMVEEQLATALVVE